jgi:cold shock CspA family protein
VFEVPRCVESNCQQARQAGSQELVVEAGKSMSRGVITKVIRSFGSTWGRVRPAGAKPELFFNLESMLNRADFATLRVGQEVEFDEEADMANGTRALRIREVWVEPYSDLLSQSRPAVEEAGAIPGSSALLGPRR